MAEQRNKEYLDKTNCCVDKKKIKRIRKDKKLRLDDLADMTGIPRASIWKVESYNFGIQLCDFLKIAKALGVSIEDLLMKDDSTI